MKTIEEKAKAYDEAIRKLRGMMPNWERLSYNGKTFLQDLIYIFPELRKSDDERIRKSLISFLKSPFVNENITDEKVAPWLAWLEKQGEQKPYGQREECLDCQFNYAGECKGSCAIKRSEQNHVDKSEPKFKVGDFIANDYCRGRVVEITDDAYLLDTEQGIPFSCEHNVHLWSIQDAKDGDVLACENGWTCIFNCLHDNLFDSHCFMDAEGWFCEDGGQAHTLDNRICGEIHPATKEQRDLLFQKMKEAGYKWYAEKKELKLLITNGGDFCE